MGDWKVADWAIETLENQPDEPFFFRWVFVPSVPWYATQPWFDLLSEDLILPPVRAQDRDDTPLFS